MKKLFSLVLLLVFALSTTYAQDISKEAKSAKRAVSTFAASGGDEEKLEKAKSAVEMLFKNDAANSNYDALMTKADLHKALVEIDFDNKSKAAFTGENYESKYIEDAYTAYDTYKMALPFAEKSSEEKAVIQAIEFLDNEFASHFSTKYSMQDFQGAFNGAQYVIDSYGFLENNGGKSFIENKEGLNEWKYYAGLMAQATQNKAALKKYMTELADASYPAPEVYSAVFADLIEMGKEEDAYAILSKGKDVIAKENKKRAGMTDVEPLNDSQLLFAEINYLIKKKDYNRLEKLLKEAIEKEPNNPSVYSTLGTVYNQLYKGASESDDPKAEEYFAEAKSYYMKAAEIDPTFFSAQYSLGELYYNRAATVIGELQALESDYSKEAIQKYDAKKKEMVDLFSQALPFFLAAEKIDPNDRNTMIAMKEIYARKDDLVTSNKIKARIEELDAGKKFDKPFHD